MHNARFSHGGVLFAASLVVTTAQAADEKAPFYEGKTITMTVGVAPGGGYDLYGRLAAEFLGAVYFR